MCIQRKFPPFLKFIFSLSVLSVVCLAGIAQAQTSNRQTINQDSVTQQAAQQSATQLSSALQAANQLAAEGIVLMETGSPAEATGYFRRAIDLFPGDPGLHIWLARSRLAAGDTDQALNTTREALDLFPGNINLRLFLVEVLRITSPREARSALLELEQDITDRDLEQAGITRAALRNYRGYLTRLVGDHLSREARYDEAATEYRRALEITPDSSSIYTNLAFIHLMNAEYEQVLELDGRVPSGDPFYAQVRARALLSMDRADEAENHYRDLYRRFPDDYQTGLNFANLLITSNKTGEAEQVLDDLIQRFPDQRGAWDALTTLYRQRNDRPGLTGLFTRMMRHFPDDEMVQLELALLYDAAGDPEQGIVLLTDLHKNGSDRLYYGRQKAFMMVRNGDADGGLILLRELIEQYPGEPDPVLETGLYFRQAGDAGNALLLFEIMTDRFPENKEGWTYLGLTLNDIQSQSTLTALERARDLGSTHAGVYHLLTAHQLRSGDAQTAAATAYTGLDKANGDLTERFSMLNLEGQTALQGNLVVQASRLQNPATDFSEREEALFGLSRHLIEMFSPQPALELLEWLRDSHPRSVYPYFFLSDYYQSADEHENAVRILNQLIRLSPREQRALIMLGDLTREQGDANEAMVWYERAFGLEPNPESYNRLIEIHRQLGTLAELANRWMIMYRSSNRRDSVLREYIIEALHKAGKPEEAAAFVRSN